MWQPDGAGDIGRIGVLTPHFDPVPETELQAMAPKGVSIHAGRVPLGMVGPDGEIIPRVDADIARAFSEPPEVDDATALLGAVSPDAIIYGFTSSSYILGTEADATLRSRLKARSGGIPIVIQCEALVAALRHLNTARIALMHPPWFTKDLDALGAAYFRDAGFDVVRHDVAMLRRDYGDPSRQQIYDWALRYTPEDADALVIGGGGFRASGVVGALEAELGRPVVTANQAALWRALQHIDGTNPVARYGRLFSLA